MYAGEVSRPQEEIIGKCLERFNLWEAGGDGCWDWDYGKAGSRPG